MAPVARFQRSRFFDYTVFGVDRVEPKFVKKQAAGRDRFNGDSAGFRFRRRRASKVGATGSYRVTESHGFTAFQRRPIALRDNLPPPSWFAYRLKPPAMRRPYILEVEYPDNAARTFVVAIRAPDRPPLSFAIETGVIWPLSEKMARREVLFWSSSPDMRVVVMNAHDGSKAAVAKIRLYEVEETTQPIRGPDPKSSRLRDFRISGTKKVKVFKLSSAFVAAGNRVFDAVDRWLREAKFFGATSVSPTAVSIQLANVSVFLVERLLAAAGQRLASSDADRRGTLWPARDAAIVAACRRNSNGA